MKLLKRTFRRFYSNEVRTSEWQLREDFGDFPPKPLGGNGPACNFTIVRLRGIGEHIHVVVMAKRIIEGAADLDSLSSTIRDHMPDDLTNLNLMFGGATGIGKKMLVRIVLGAVFLASVLKLVRFSPKGMNSLGYFAPIRNGEFEIVIKVGRLAVEGMCTASMISHEHIHLLQHKGEDPVAHNRGVSLSDDQLFTEFTRSHKILPHLKYILEKNEVEARLHELVVSFYLEHKNLPLSVPSFLALLAASKEIGQLVSETLAEVKVEFGPVLGEFIERDRLQARDLLLVLSSMPEDLTLKFIAEVLPVMYGNLLKYYGDDVVSRKFLAQISRPNFYDQLYALPAPAPAECEALSQVTSE